MSDTHFGYAAVAEEAKAGRVRGVFDSVARRYDVMNDLMSLGLLRAEEVEVVPRVDAGVVAVGEARQHRIVADRLDRSDLDVALAGLQHLLPRAVALHLGRRRIDAHQLERDAKGPAVVEADFEDARALMQRDRGRMVRLGAGAHGARSDRGRRSVAKRPGPAPVGGKRPA